MTEQKRTKRSDAEIIADLERKLENVKAKAAQETAKDNPILSEVVTTIEDANKDITRIRKNFAPSNTSNFEMRIESHTVWIDEIRADQQFSEASLNLELSRKEFSQETLSVAAEMISEGSSEDSVSQFIEERKMHFLDKFSDLINEVNVLGQAFEAAHEARQDFIAKKKGVN